MSTYLKCKICGLSSDSSFDEATEKTRCELFAHVFEEFTYLKPTYIKKRKYGVCDIVKAHKNVLQSDPERLKSEFIINLVYGTEGKEFYLERKNRRFKNAEI